MAEASELVVGIDGGGSKTIALLARQPTGGSDMFTVVVRAAGGPTNPQAVGFDAACVEIDRLVSAAVAAIGVAPGELAAACIALAGAGRPDDQRRIEQWAAERRLARVVSIVSDGMAVLAAGTGDLCGVAVIAGTGSFAFGRRADATTARAGGWGWLLGDEGSGFAIAAAALRAVVQAHDRSERMGPLAKAILGHLQLTDPRALVRWVYADFQRSRIASLAPLVTAARQQGDPEAAAIIDQAAAELAQQAACVARRLEFTERPFPLVLAGGVLIGEPHLGERICAGLAERGFTAAPVTFVAEPAQGAVRIAIELAAGRLQSPVR